MKKYLPVLLSLCIYFLSSVFPWSVLAQASNADLVITNLQLTDAQGNVKTSFQPNEQIYYRVTIANQGSQRTADRYDNRIYHTYYRNSPQAISNCATPSDPRNFYSYSTTNFPAGSSFVYESYPGGTKEAQFPGVRTFTQSTPGTYTARAYVDYDCRAIETNDANNQRTVSYTILGQAAPTPTPTTPPAQPTPTQAVPTATPTTVPVGGTTPPPTAPQPSPAGQGTVMQPVSPEVGAWIIDSEVTKIGKNASRSGMLLDWTLRDYQWAYVREGDTNPLVPFWLIIQRIVYALFLFVVLVTAFILIVTRGKSLSAKRFLPRFLLVVLLVTFSFSLVQLLYQITDIFQGFFLKNPQGAIISSRDLLFIGWDYRDFQGLRRFGEEFEESALMSLLFVKLTAFTYYVMAILLIIRKIILWFFIILSPIFPILLLFYPVRNTAKIWIGEFFRWLLYAPLFAIFLSGLVRLWQTSLPLAFNFADAGKEGSIIYPTVIGILLGGPRQNVSLLNSLNVPDTFALYLVAILMLWVVIILPFILLQIFLEYMYNANFKDNPVVKQIIGRVNNRFAPVTNPTLPPGTPPPTRPTGRARTIPFNKRFSLPKTTGLSRPIPTGEARQINTARPVSTQLSRSNEIMRLAQVSMPTMRDIARFDTTRLSRDTRSRQEVERIQHVLERIANPTQITNMTERERAREMRERLVTESQKGNQAAATILQAAQTMSSYSNTSSSSVVSQAQTQNQTLTTLITQLANPQQITSLVEREKITTLKERIEKEVRSGSQVATTILNAVNSLATNSTSSLRETLSRISQPQNASAQDRQVYQNLREKIVTASQSGNELATLIVNSLDKTTSSEQVKIIQEKLLHAQANGSQLAQEILRTVNTTNITNITKNSLTTFKEGLQKLSHPESISRQDEQQVYKQLREKIVTASESGNELASLLVSSFETTTSTEQLQQLQEKVLAAKAQGSELATELVTTLEKATSKDSSQTIEAIQTKLEEAKKQGDPLATTLLTMLAQRHRETSKAPVKGIKGQKNAGFPVVNRLQQVSLDDYEAVKSLWKENYQNLDVPQSLAGERTRKEWINEDISEIEQTISLLSSNNAQEVEEGMQKVSDILPFLLIGGFSQTEIIAYMKAKLEAGKSVLEQVESTESEEDTMIEAKRSSTQTPKVQHMTTSVEVNNEYNTTNTTNNATNAPSFPVQNTNYQTTKSVVRPSKSSEQAETSSYITQILQMANLSLPSLRDIVRYERDSHTSSQQDESQSLRSVLLALSHPETVKNSKELEQLRSIKEELIKQSRVGDKIAASILTATQAMSGDSSSEFTVEDQELLLSVLKASSNPALSSSEERSQYTQINSLLTQLKRQGDPFATRVDTFIKDSEKADIESVQSFLQKIAHPENVHIATERMQYTKLRERIGEAGDNRNQLALTILQATDGASNPTQVAEVAQKLYTAKEQGDSLASYILNTLVSSSELVHTETEKVYRELVTQKKAGDRLAITILDLLRKKQKQRSPSNHTLSLPKQNRLQQVSLDDYEAVKNMWYENYLKADVPLGADGQSQTRIQWVQGDMASITELINLLSSDQEEQNEEGMQRVSDILPFLLIGGFSQQEVIGYLKAKLEAGKMALITLQQATQEEELVPSTKSHTESPKHLSATEEVPQSPPDEIKKGDKEAEAENTAN